jgi:hypothetical protein
VWSHGAIAAPTRDRETNVATDDVIQQRLGEAPEDEAVKERLEREHGELLEELRAP